MLLVTVDPPLAQQASLRPTTASRPWSSPKNTKIGYATEELVLSPTNQRHRHPRTHLHLPPSPLFTCPPGGEGSCGRIQNILPFVVGGEWYGNTPNTLFLCFPQRKIESAILPIDIRLPPRIKIASANRPKSRTQSIPGFPPDKTASATGHGYGSEGVKGRRWQQEDIRFARSFWTIFCF